MGYCGALWGAVGSVGLHTPHSLRAVTRGVGGLSRPSNQRQVHIPLEDDLQLCKAWGPAVSVDGELLVRQRGDPWGKWGKASRKSGSGFGHKKHPKELVGRSVLPFCPRSTVTDQTNVVSKRSR